jgi:hypothetical protein
VCVESRRSIILVVAATGLLWWAGQQTPHLAGSRSTTAGRSPETELTPLTASPLPPTVAFTTVVLAGFRGLAADLLWLRATALQDEGRYIELVQLADWITVLEPQFSEVWALQAWNMAYNVSVMFPGDKERWRWVQNGIRLLRDRGLHYNATAPLLYHELGWLFLHKIGTNVDPSAAYYKRQWASRMLERVGPDGHPDYVALKRDAAAARSLKDMGLDPERMEELDIHYGPLDWRVAETHALYWACLGQAVAGPDNTSASCERMIYHSMAALFDHGQLTYIAGSEQFVTSPRFDLLPNVMQTFETAMSRSENSLPAEAYVSFLSSAVRLLKFYQNEVEARTLFDELHRRFPSHATLQGLDAFVRGASPSLPQVLSPPQETTE